ncbi:hypothetical protein P7L64_15585 [Tistrella bauzanensis]|nr:hypothetical protein [Tistrella bauzanensis]
MAILNTLCDAGHEGRISALVGLRVLVPRFLTDTILVEILLDTAGEGFALSVMFAMSADQVVHFDGTAAALDRLRAAGRVRIADDSDARAYLILHGNLVCGEAGPFLIVESKADAPSHISAPLIAAVLDRSLKPVVLKAVRANGAYLIEAVMCYDSTLFVVDLEVSPDGAVEMIDSEAIARGIPFRVHGFVSGFRVLHDPDSP